MFFYYCCWWWWWWWVYVSLLLEEDVWRVHVISGLTSNCFHASVVVGVVGGVDVGVGGGGGGFMFLCQGRRMGRMRPACSIGVSCYALRSTAGVKRSLL